MNAKEFADVVDTQMQICQLMLGVKAAEYASDEDRLYNFKVAAGLQGVTPQEALAGMMAKHTVSVYDLIRQDSVTMSMWEEKISDHINYLLLLKAVLIEDQKSE